MRRYILIVVMSVCYRVTFSQNFVNGSFENNTANGTDQINLPNTNLNAMLTGVNAFGSYGDVDIIKSSTYGGGGAQDKEWYLGITGGGTDIIALSLTAPLVAGKTYSLSFYDRKDNAHPVNHIQIGLSPINSNFGTAIYTATELPIAGIWTLRSFTFTASFNAAFITVQMPAGSISEWANIDNFAISPIKCNQTLSVQSSVLLINKGEAVTFTVNDVSSFTLSSPLNYSACTQSIVTNTPFVSTTYTLINKEGNCPILTQTLAVVVKQPIIKDTVIVNTIKNIDTVPFKQPPLKFSRRILNGRKFTIQQRVNSNNALVKLVVWDNNTVDGDMVSIYLNGQLLQENISVTNIKKELLLHLQTGSNIIVMEAINLGRVPPNTATIGINIHKPITLVSDLKTSAAIEIIYTNDAVTIK